MRWVLGVRALVSHIYRSRLDSRGVSTVLFFFVYIHSQKIADVALFTGEIQYIFILLWLDFISGKLHIKIPTCF